MLKIIYIFIPELKIKRNYLFKKCEKSHALPRILIKLKCQNYTMMTTTWKKAQIKTATIQSGDGYP